MKLVLQAWDSKEQQVAVVIPRKQRVQAAAHANLIRAGITNVDKDVDVVSWKFVCPDHARFSHGAEGEKEHQQRNCSKSKMKPQLSHNQEEQDAQQKNMPSQANANIELRQSELWFH